MSTHVPYRVYGIRYTKYLDYLKPDDPSICQ